MSFLLESSRLCKNDSKAFLFSLKNPTNDPRKLPQIHNWNFCAVLSHRRLGPSFDDLRIRDHANRNRSCNEYLGYTYTVPSGKRGDPFLTGDSRFTASEVETFYETIQWRCKTTVPVSYLIIPLDHFVVANLSSLSHEVSILSLSYFHGSWYSWQCREALIRKFDFAGALQIARVTGVEGIMGMLLTEYVLKIGCYEFRLV